MISIKAFSVAYDEVIVKHINCQIPQGTIIVLLGENGCGKTTMMKALAGILHYEGTITVDGCDVGKMNAKKRAHLFGYVPQMKAMTDHIAMMDFLCSGAVSQYGLFQTPDDLLKERVLSVLKTFHCMHLKDCYLDEISGGELQLVYVMRCVIQSPLCYILDEPTTYLDYRHQHQFFQQIMKLKQQDASVLISVHDPNLALQYGDIVWMMKDGVMTANIDLRETDAKKQFYHLYHEWYPQVQLYETESDVYIVWKGEEAC